MMHFAYPNVIPRDGTFLGCGRYVAASLGNPPGPDYSLVELNIPNITEVHLASLQLAPESADSNIVIYERRDPSPHPFRGESRDLAYVLALVSRTRSLRLSDRQGDLWCTGRIDIKGENRPFLKAVDVTGFSCKLDAFLNPEQPDMFFLVPAANVLPSHEIRFQEQRVRVVSLLQFRHTLEQGEITRKVIVKIQGDELDDLIEVLYLLPESDPHSHALKGQNPYRGLFVFREQDFDVFFGRDIAIRQCHAILQQRAFLALIGPSGSGKSSLMYAGIIPALRRQGHWHIITFRLETDPWHALLAALMPALETQKSEEERVRALTEYVERLKTHQITLQALLEHITAKHPGFGFLLFLDQSEELYTLCPEPQERQHFLNAILTIPATPHWHLTLAMRADFLGKACAYRPFADILQHVNYLIGPMNREELREVIERPAEMRGVRIEDGLTDRILDALGDEPGTLPLLEFALSQLWEQQQNHTLTHAAYREIGGVKQALAQYADALYLRLHPDDQEQGRRIFTQLIHPGEGTEDIRRVATRSEIGEASWELVTKLADARLVVTGTKPPHGGPQSTQPQEETVEVVHEALIHGWQRLRTWLEKEREFRMWQERLRGAIRQWISSRQDEGGLLRGAMLAEAEQWMLTNAAALSVQEKAFIQASVELHKQEIALQEQEIATRKRQQRWNLIGLSIACFIALVLAVVAFSQNKQSQWQRQLAEEQRKVAEQQRQIAYARQQEAEQERHRAEIQARNASENLLQAEVNAIKALSQTSKALLFSHDDLGALLTGVKAARQATRSSLPDELMQQVLFNLREVLDQATEYRRFEGHEGAAKSVGFSPDGQLLASGSNDGSILIWDVTSGRKVRELRGHLTAVKAVSFSPDGRLLASGGVDTTVRLWDIATGERIDTLLGHLNAVQSLCFNYDGRLLSSGSDDHTVKLWHIPSRNKIATFSGHLSAVKSVRFSPDGELLASGSDDGTIKVWDVNRQQERATLYGHTQAVWSVDVSPDGQLLASGSDDGFIKIWFLADSSELRTISGHTDGVRSVRFHPQGHLLASGSDDFDKTIKIWDVQRGDVIKTLEGHFNSVVSLDFDPNGRLLASASDDQRVKVWDISDHADRSTIYASPEGIEHLAFHPEGALIAISGNTDGTILLWDIVNQRRFRTIYGYAGQVHSMSFHPDGAVLASANHDQTISLWEVASGKQIGVLRGHRGVVRSVDFSSDGRWLVSGSDDSTVMLWDVTTRQSVFSLESHLGAISSVVFSPDGVRFASAGEDATIRLWNRSDGTEQMTLRNPYAIMPMRSIAFSPDGTIIASGGSDNSITLWDLADGREMQRLQGHARTVTSLTFNRNGRWLASSSLDHTIKLWSLPEGRELTTLREHHQAVNSVQFHPERPVLASGGDDGHVKVWNFDLNAYISRGCRILSGYLPYNPHVTDEDRGLCQDLSESPDR